MQYKHFIENNLLFDLLYNKDISDWEDKLEEEEFTGDIEKINAIKDDLNKSLDEEGRKKLNDLLFEIGLSVDYFKYRICMLVFYYAIGFGQRLQRNLDEFILDKL